jgi:hypothetical protein
MTFQIDQVCDKQQLKTLQETKTYERGRFLTSHASSLELLSWTNAIFSPSLKRDTKAERLFLRESESEMRYSHWLSGCDSPTAWHCQ